LRAQSEVVPGRGRREVGLDRFLGLGGPEPATRATAALPPKPGKEIRDNRWHGRNYSAV